MRHYSIAGYETASDFLRHLAKALELPLADGSDAPDPALAALAFLEQWRLGRVPFCARAPVPPTAPAPAESSGRASRKKTAATTAAPAAPAAPALSPLLALLREVYSEQVRAHTRTRAGRTRAHTPLAPEHTPALARTRTHVCMRARTPTCTCLC
jgi:hypothetical protein